MDYTCTALTLTDPEIDRAFENLCKHGKMFNGMGMPPRRDSIPMMGVPFAQQYGEYGTRTAETKSELTGIVPRMPHGTSADLSHGPHPGHSLQNFYASQRQQSRPNEVDSMLQAKFRVTAQQGCDLRGYHPEQHVERGKKNQKMDSFLADALDADKAEIDGITSPKTELKSESQFAGGRPSHDFNFDAASNDRQFSQLTGSNALRGPSPRSYDPFAVAPITQGFEKSSGVRKLSEQSLPANRAPAGKAPQDNASNNTSASNSASQSYALFDATHQSSRTSTSSASGSPPNQSSKSTGPGPAPIGTRPGQTTVKRGVTPTQSPLSYAFQSTDKLNTIETHDDEQGKARRVDRAASLSTYETAFTSQSGNKVPNEASGAAWGTNSGAWGSAGNKTIGTVWG